MSDSPASLPDVSLLGVINGALRRRRLLVGLPALLAVITVVVALVWPRRYTASVAFTPASSGNQLAGLAGVAAEFGVNIPQNGDEAESPQFYADLSNSQPFLEQLVDQPYTISIGGTLASVRMDSLFDVSEKSPAATRTRTAQKLDQYLNATVSPATGVVRITVSLQNAALADSVIHRTLAQIQAFNSNTHQSKATWERQFIDSRIKSATAELTDVEAQLGEFLIRNRDYSRSPQLQFQADKLQRQVALRQDVLTTLARSLEQAKIDEVKAEPVLTIVEPASVSPLPDRRRLALKAILAVFAGLVIALVIVVGSEYSRAIAADDGAAAAEFAGLSHETGRDVRRWLGPLGRLWPGRSAD